MLRMNASSSQSQPDGNTLKQKSSLQRPGRNLRDPRRPAPGLRLRAHPQTHPPPQTHRTPQRGAISEAASRAPFSKFAFGRVTRQCLPASNFSVGRDGRQKRSRPNRALTPNSCKANLGVDPPAAEGGPRPTRQQDPPKKSAGTTAGALFLCRSRSDPREPRPDPAVKSLTL